MRNESTTKPINNQQLSITSALKSQTAGIALAGDFWPGGTFSDVWISLPRL